MNGGPLDALRRHIDELFAARAAHYCIHHASIRASRHKSERGLGKSRCPLKRSSQEENGGYIHATWGRKLLFGVPEGLPRRSQHAKIDLGVAATPAARFRFDYPSMANNEKRSVVTKAEPTIRAIS